MPKSLTPSARQREREIMALRIRLAPEDLKLAKRRARESHQLSVAYTAMHHSMEKQWPRSEIVRGCSDYGDVQKAQNLADMPTNSHEKIKALWKMVDTMKPVTLHEHLKYLSVVAELIKEKAVFEDKDRSQDFRLYSLSLQADMQYERHKGRHVAPVRTLEHRHLDSRSEDSSSLPPLRRPNKFTTRPIEMDNYLDSGRLLEDRIIGTLFYMNRDQEDDFFTVESCAKHRIGRRFHVQFEGCGFTKPMEEAEFLEFLAVSQEVHLTQ